jgi:predicted DNA-binding transcriptional regulator AlpA
MAESVHSVLDSDIDPHKTRRFLSYREVQAALFLSRTSLFRLRRDRAFPLADVMVTPDTYGWDAERIQLYGLETGRLDERGQPAGGWDDNGRPRNRVRDGALATMQKLVADRFSAPTRVYLGTMHCSYLYGLTDLSVYFLRKRGAFFSADVRIGEKFLGWSETNVIRFGHQTGRLEDPAVLAAWARRRTEDFGLDPRTPWVVELLGEDNLPQLPEAEPQEEAVTTGG